MTSQLDPYTVVTARPPEPPEDPDPAAMARENQLAMFSQEKDVSAWTAPLSPVRAGRQRLPVPDEQSGETGARAVERASMCVLGPGGGHVSRGLHCPHSLPAPGDQDSVTCIDFWA